MSFVGDLWNIIKEITKGTVGGTSNLTEFLAKHLAYESNRDRGCMYGEYTPGQSVVLITEDKDFGGQFAWLSLGEEWENLTEKGMKWRNQLLKTSKISWNDQITCIAVIAKDVEVELWEHIHFQGARLVLGHGSHDLVRLRWNDKVSSIRVSK